MSKVKMRCARCGKPFKSSDAKQTLCPDCSAKERLARAQKGAAAQQPTPAAKPAQAPKIVGPGASILGVAPTAAPAAPPPDRGLFGSAARAAEQEERRTHEQGPAADHTRGPQGPHAPHGPAQRHEPAASTAHGAHPAHGAPSAHGAHPAHTAPGTHGKRAERSAGTATATREPKQPKPPREPKERKQQPPQELTPEQRTQVEQRYLELAQPAEFDGIRTQIATELSLPKALVRTAVLDLRKRMQLPSWWELQAFPGTQTDLERIRAVYEPLLPIPPVGVHKQISEQLGLEPHVVYRGIRQIRASMRLPQFNPPDLHPELAERRAADASASTTAPASVAPASVATASVAPPPVSE